MSKSKEEIIEEMDKAFPKETQEDIVFPDKNKYGYDYYEDNETREYFLSE